MPEIFAYERVAGKYPVRIGPDPIGNSSQDAAGNKPPGKHGDLTEKVDSKKKPADRTEPEPAHVDPPPRDVREAPAPNPNGKPVEH